MKQGFQVREDYWGGDLGVGEKKAVRQQLFKGNEYWFWMGTEVEQAKVSVHIYDADGKLVRAARQLAEGPFRRCAPHPEDYAEAILSSWRWRVRRKSEHTGRWSTALDKALPSRARFDTLPAEVVSSPLTLFRPAR